MYPHLRVTSMLKIPNRHQMLRFLSDEEAATAVEYAVMLALIIAVCAGSVVFMADRTKESFDSSGAAIAGAFAN